MLFTYSTKSIDMNNNKNNTSNSQQPSKEHKTTVNLRKKCFAKLAQFKTNLLKLSDLNQLTVNHILVPKTSFSGQSFLKCLAIVIPILANPSHPMIIRRPNLFKD